MYTVLTKVFSNSVVAMIVAHNDSTDVEDMYPGWVAVYRTDRFADAIQVADEYSEQIEYSE